VKLTTYQLSQLLQVSTRSALRLSTTLQFVKRKEGGKLYYYFDTQHPLTRSLPLTNNTQAKPIYSITDIASLWQWRKGYYSKERVRQLLDQYDITIYNKHKKGFIYLIDLQKLLK
jgi:hypothetical protein